MAIPRLDKCPGYNLYIGGAISLRRPQALKNANITHIVSVLDWKLEENATLLRGYQHLHIPVDDVEDENLLEWFPRSNAFIHAGLHYWRPDLPSVRNDSKTSFEDGGEASGVLIHCAMGKSRSATVLLAYLLWASRQVRNASNASHSSAPLDAEMVSLPPTPLSVVEALMILRQGRPFAEPNEGFMDQLHMYESMGCPGTESELKRHKIYRRWMNKRSVDESIRVNMAPEMAAIQFEDEVDDEDSYTDKPGVALATSTSSPSSSSSDRADSQAQTKTGRGGTASRGHFKSGTANTNIPTTKALDDKSSISPLSSPSSTSSPSLKAPSSSQNPLKPRVTLKCRKCRHALATTPFILPHVPPPHVDPAFYQSQSQSTSTDDEGNVVGSPSSKCAHIFLHPLSWMRPALSEGQMEGRLSCPNAKCNSNIGKFAWTGLRCSCGGWVTPGFGVARGKVDETVVRPATEDASSNGAAQSGLRLPPSMRKSGGNL